VTLTEFLLARIAEDEATAQGWQVGSIVNPARALAECEAKRRIIDGAVEVARVDLNEPVDPDDQGLRDVGVKILCALALPYADHPDYLPEWKP
jgi:hypothetical protein